MTAAEHLRGAQNLLSVARDHLGQAAGELRDLEHGAALKLRTEIADVERRLGNLIKFTSSGVAGAPTRMSGVSSALEGVHPSTRHADPDGPRGHGLPSS